MRGYTGKDILWGIAFLLFLGAVYCLIVFVTAAFIATSSGLILWGEGWEALKEHLWISNR